MPYHAAIPLASAPRRAVVVHRAAMRVALVHDWLVANRGGEKVLDALCELYPQSEIFTLIHRPGSASPRVESRPIHTSFLQRVPGIWKRFRHFLPVMPLAISSLRPRGFDLVISSSHCVAHAVPVPQGVPHLTYVHAPMRYMWDLFDDYFGPGRASWPVRLAASSVRHPLQRWDRHTAQSPGRVVANSRNIAQKVAQHWGRQAEVVYPPVELERFLAAPPLESRPRQSYLLWVGAFAPYKRADLAIEAARRLQLPLWIAGAGQEGKRLAQGLPPNVRMLGQVSDADLPALYRNARALVFPGDEDFGITPLEAQACGTPVVALGRGGALETLTPQTAVFFSAQSADGLCQALQQLEAFEEGFSPQRARENAARFTRSAFMEGIRVQVEQLLASGRST